MPAKFELIAPCFFGCESTAKFELTRIGAENIRVDDGRLSFAGGAEMIAAANLNLRTVERVMLLLARYRAATFDDLFDGVYDIPWEELLPADAAFPVTGSSLNSQLSSVPACQSIIKKAVVKRLMAKHHTSVLPETGAEYKIRFMLRKDQCEIMLDTTGDGLHKRGYRRNAMEAPIRETLAATIADLGRVRRDSLVEDPFCGSGTLLIEAAQKAMNIAPGLKRRFAAAGHDIDDATADHLLFTCGSLMTELVPEIGKIAAYAKGRAVTVEDINAVADPVLDARVFDMTNSITAGKYDQAAQVLGELLRMQTEPIVILAAVGKELRRLYTARMALDAGKDRFWLKQLWSMSSDYPAKLLMQAAGKVDHEWCQTAVIRCQRLDRRMKSEKNMDSEAELKLFLMELAGSR